MGTPFSFIGKLFGIKPRKTAPNRVRTVTNGTTWGDVVEAFQSAGNYTGTSKSALKVAAFFACNDRIAKDVSTLPFRVTRKSASGYEIATDHDQYFVSRSPSQVYSKSRFFYVLNAHVNIWGNGYAEIIRRGGRPVEYVILHPSCVEIKLIDGKKMFLYSEEGQPKRVIADENMIHGMWYSEDGICGKSVLSYARDTLDLAKNSSKLSSQLYENQMWSPGYISYKEELTKEQAELISETWQSTLGEQGKDHINILDRGSEFKHYGMSLKDAEYLGTSINTELQVCRFMGVPPTKIGLRDGSNVSYNSLEQDNIAYVQDTILPRVIMWEEEFDRKALRESDMDTVRFKFELKSRLRGDMAARSAFYQMGLSSGLLSINDVLKLEDMNTIGAEGDERYINGAYVPLSKLHSGELDNERELSSLMNGIKLNGNAKQIQHSRT